MSLEDSLKNILNQYKNDELMLDGFRQWAMNPTPKEAGYGIKQNTFFIVMNLHERYGLLVPQVEQRIQQLQDECDNILKTSGMEDIDLLRADILKQLQTNLGDTLNHGIARRFEQASIETKNIAGLLYTLKARGCGGKTWESFEEWLPTGFKPNPGYSYLYLSVRKSLVKVGLLDMLTCVNPTEPHKLKIEYYLLELPATVLTNLPKPELMPLK
jgi:hypothetical protein